MAINSRISFIPKSPLTREELFMERRRPRSIMGFLAILVFVVSIGAYAGFYFYNSSLLKEIDSKTADIQKIQQVLVQSPQIKEARLFRARADLARDLLDTHIVISPLFEFLSQNTLTSIFYDKFSFKKEEEVWMLTLTGEAPSYASLAYQADLLRKKTNEFVDFSINDIALTKFGSVTFTFIINFAQGHLSYTRVQTANASTLDQQGPITTGTPLFETPTSEVTSPASSLPSEPPAGGEEVAISSEANLLENNVVTIPVVEPLPPQAEGGSFWQSLWSWIKFW